MSPDALYWADDDIVFCVTHTKRWTPQNEDGPGTEMDWLTPEELRFIGSLLLCEVEGEGKLLFYPVHYYSPIINRRTLTFTRPAIAEALRNLVVHGLSFPEFGHNAEVLQQCLRLRRSRTSTRILASHKDQGLSSLTRVKRPIEGRHAFRYNIFSACFVLRLGRHIIQFQADIAKILTQVFFLTLQDTHGRFVFRREILIEGVGPCHP